LATGALLQEDAMALNGAEVVARCASVLVDVIGPHIPKDRPAALVDYPHSLNNGDHAIWLGEKAFLNSLGVKVTYECDAFQYDRALMAKSIGDGPILMHGGGNFGDLYMLYHEFRLRVMEDFPDNKVILFPQQSTFLNDAYLNRTRALIARHRDVTLIARDVVTHHMMSRQFGDRARILLAPDMAFALGPQQRLCAPTYDIVWIARTDGEKAHPNDPAVAAGLTDLTPSRIKPAGFADGLTINYGARRRGEEVLITDWYEMEKPEDLLTQLNALDRDPMSSVYLSRALLLLSMGRLVITDRLHAHILCLMLGIPHILLNNALGKNWNFYETWTRDSGLCRLALDSGAAWSIAREAIGALPDKHARIGGWLQTPMALRPDQYGFGWDTCSV
jgi:pyruvyl transferase EpsO